MGFSPLDSQSNIQCVFYLSIHTAKSELRDASALRNTDILSREPTVKTVLPPPSEKLMKHNKNKHLQETDTL